MRVEDVSVVDDVLHLTGVTGHIKDGETAGQVFTVGNQHQLNVGVNHARHCHEGDHVVVYKGLNTSAATSTVVLAHIVCSGDGGCATVATAHKADGNLGAVVGTHTVEGGHVGGDIATDDGSQIGFCGALGDEVGGLNVEGDVLVELNQILILHFQGELAGGDGAHGKKVLVYHVHLEVGGEL